MNSETHPFQVSIWLPGNNNPKSLYEHGQWQEYARCLARPRANEVALCLSLRHPGGVKVAELVKDDLGCFSWQGCKYLPEAARELQRKEER